MQKSAHPPGLTSRYARVDWKVGKEIVQEKTLCYVFIYPIALRASPATAPTAFGHGLWIWCLGGGKMSM